MPQFEDFAIHGQDKVKGFMEGQVLDGKVILMVLDPDRKATADVIQQNMTSACPNSQRQTITILDRGHRWNSAEAETGSSELLKPLHGLLILAMDWTGHRY